MSLQTSPVAQVIEPQVNEMGVDGPPPAPVALKPLLLPGPLLLAKPPLVVEPTVAVVEPAGVPLVVAAPVPAWPLLAWLAPVPPETVPDVAPVGPTLLQAAPRTATAPHTLILRARVLRFTPASQTERTAAPVSAAASVARSRHLRADRYTRRRSFQVLRAPSPLVAGMPRAARGSIDMGGHEMNQRSRESRGRISRRRGGSALSARQRARGSALASRMTSTWWVTLSARMFTHAQP
jgi:hypothetical protein